METIGANLEPGSCSNDSSPTCAYGGLTRPASSRTAVNLFPAGLWRSFDATAPPTPALPPHRRGGRLFGTPGLSAPPRLLVPLRLTGPPIVATPADRPADRLALRLPRSESCPKVRVGRSPPSTTMTGITSRRNSRANGKSVRRLRSWVGIHGPSMAHGLRQRANLGGLCRTVGGAGPIRVLFRRPGDRANGHAGRPPRLGQIGTGVGDLIYGCRGPPLGRAQRRRRR